jgi:hypothetical protein
VLHNFRTFMWISTNFKRCSLRDYRSWARLSSFPQHGLRKCSRVRTKLREWFRLWLFYSDATSQSHRTNNRRWNLVSFVTVETKEQSKQWMHTYSSNTPKTFEQTLSGRKLIATVILNRKWVQMAEFTTRDNNVRSAQLAKRWNIA